MCPGSAGRNRVLSIKRIPEVTIHDISRRSIYRQFESASKKAVGRLGMTMKWPKRAQVLSERCKRAAEGILPLARRLKVDKGAEKLRDAGRRSCRARPGC
jgi:hypothetical protein